MRGRVAAVAVCALATVAGAQAAEGHPGHGPVTVNVANFAFDPANVVIGQNDVVAWYFSSAIDRNHSITTDPGQAESFDSNPETSNPPQRKRYSVYSWAFRNIGRFTYYCKNHSGMRGTVEVRAIPPPVDRLSPTLSRARIRNRTLAFDLSEKADVTARIQRRQRGRWRTKRTLYFRGKSGRNRRKLSYRRLASGRYRLLLRAYDAGGLAADAVAVRFRVKRGR